MTSCRAIINKNIASFNKTACLCSTFPRYITELHQAGRLPNQKDDNRSKRMAEEMIKQGIEEQIVWASNTQLLVPSASHKNVTWLVELVNYQCTCPVSSQPGKSNWTPVISASLTRGVFSIMFQANKICVVILCLIVSKFKVCKLCNILFEMTVGN